MNGSNAPVAPGPTAAGLVYFEDRGTIYDAPLETLWDFMERDEEFHPRAHRSEVRNFVDEKLSDVSILIRYERLMEGGWVNMACRMTTVRPAVRVQEDLDGPYAGSTTVYLYTPQGDRTAVDIFGYARSSTLSAEEIRRDKAKTYSNAYAEDVPYLRRFAEQQRSRRV